MRSRIWKTALPMALLAAGVGQGWAAPLAAPLTMKLPFAVERVEPQVCQGQATAVVVGKNGTRYRVLVAKGLLGIEPVRDCPLPDPPSKPDFLEDGILTRGSGSIAEAWLAVPTLKYRHGALGDVVEAAELRAVNRRGEQLRYRLDDQSVFEDRLARMVYLGRQDGLLVVRTRLSQGAALALFTLKDGADPDQQLELAAESAPLGQPNRWLNPVGVEDFDGDGQAEIAAVLAPHTGGTLVLYRREGSRLAEKYRAAGFSNHRLYSRDLGMSAVLDMNGDKIPDLVVPAADRRSVRVVTFAGGSFRELMRARYDVEVATGMAVADLDGNGKMGVAYALEDGTLAALVR
jgi:hypothetical protein